MGQPCGLRFGDGLLDDGVPAVVDLDQVPRPTTSTIVETRSRVSGAHRSVGPAPIVQSRAWASSSQLTTSCCRTWPRTRSWTATRSGAPVDRVQRETGNGPRRPATSDPMRGSSPRRDPRRLDRLDHRLLDRDRSHTGRSTWPSCPVGWGTQLHADSRGVYPGYR